MFEVHLHTFPSVTVNSLLTLPTWHTSEARPALSYLWVPPISEKEKEKKNNVALLLPKLDLKSSRIGGVAQANEPLSVCLVAFRYTCLYILGKVWNKRFSHSII